MGTPPSSSSRALSWDREARIDLWFSRRFPSGYFSARRSQNGPLIARTRPPTVGHPRVPDASRWFTARLLQPVCMKLRDDGRGLNVIHLSAGQIGKLAAAINVNEPTPATSGKPRGHGWRSHAGQDMLILPGLALARQ